MTLRSLFAAIAVMFGWKPKPVPAEIMSDLPFLTGPASPIATGAFRMPFLVVDKRMPPNTIDCINTRDWVEFMHVRIENLASPHQSEGTNEQN